MKKKRNNQRITAEERALWREETRHDTRLASPGESGEVLESNAEETPAAPEIYPVSIPVLRTPPRAKPPKGTDMDRRTAERFRRGEMPIDRRLDLHGMTQEAAHAALIRTVEGLAARGGRLLLLITGKGRAGEGILKRAVPIWLAEPGLARYILSHAPAAQHHGGTGAFYVLLRRKRHDA